MSSLLDLRDNQTNHANTTSTSVMGVSTQHVQPSNCTLSGFAPSKDAICTSAALSEVSTSTSADLSEVCDEVIPSCAPRDRFGPRSQAGDSGVRQAMHSSGVVLFRAGQRGPGPLQHTDGQGRAPAGAHLSGLRVIALWSLTSLHTVGAVKGLFVGCLLNVPATCECISGTDLLRQFDVLPQ